MHALSRLRLMTGLAAALALGVAAAACVPDEEAPAHGEALPDVIDNGASEAGDTGAAVIRFVDVGAGLCVIASFPGDQHLLYDAGPRGSHCRNAVREMVSDGVIELVVISHPDTDHLGELEAILRDFPAETILHTGYDRSQDRWKATWQSAMEAITGAEARGSEVINLANQPLEPGRSFVLGEATATFIAGWGAWDPAPSDPGGYLGDPERRNVVSIVMRIDYGGRSVLLTGDSIGRHSGDNADACRHAQSIMVSRHNDDGPSLTADVMLSSHHGGDNGDASCFIEAVSPDYIVISAGNSHGHPRASTVQRYLNAGIPAERIFRTDRGSGGNLEWDHLNVPGCRSMTGYDDVIVRIPSDPDIPISVGYRIPETPAETEARLRAAPGQCRTDE